MRILEFVESILENRVSRELRCEDGQDGDASATRHRLAPAVLGASHCSALGLSCFWTDQRLARHVNNVGEDQQKYLQCFVCKTRQGMI